MARYVFSKRYKRVFVPLFILAWCDCIGMFVLHSILNGDASTTNGAYIRDGHYFLHNKVAPHFIEVSKNVWQFSHYQMMSVALLYALVGMLAVYFFYTGDVKRIA